MDWSLRVACHSVIALGCIANVAAAQSSREGKAQDANLAVSAAPLRPSDVAGRWEIRIDAGGEIYSGRLELTLEQRDGELTGRYVSGEGRRDRIQKVEISGQSIVVTVATRRSTRRAVATFAGDLVSPTRMVGEVDFDYGGGSRSYEFAANRIGGAVEASVSDSSSLADVAAAQSEADLQRRQDGASEPVESAMATNKSGTVSFQQDVDEYSAAVDVEIWHIAPDKPLLRLGTMTADGNNGGGESQVLMRFGEVFGSGENQAPPNSRIVSATLTVVAFDPGTTVYLHRVLAPWTPAATWNALAGGVAIDNVEASTLRDGFSFGQINMDKQSVQFDVTQTVQKWSDGAPNYGWVFVNTGDNGWDFYSSDWIEDELRPRLEIKYELR